MNRNEETKFKAWKRAHSMDEGFLDGEEEQPVVAKDSTGEEETKETEEKDTSVDSLDDNVDISEEVGS